MKIRFFILKDQMGNQLSEYFQNHWEECQTQEFLFAQNTWLDIHGRSGLKEGAEYTFNAPEALKNALMEGNKQEIFRLNRIPVSRVGEEEPLRSLEALILDQKLLFLRMQQDNGKFKYVKPASYPMVSDLAKRAAYLLGLDFALVQVVMNRQRRYVVRKINPAPKMREKDFLTLTRYIEKLKQTLPNTGGEVLLGADPEFMLANGRNGKMMFASDFFPRLGRVGCDDIRSRNQQKRPVAEIRPDPDYSPVKLTENIFLALREAEQMAPYRSVKWLAGSQPFNSFSTGGHVHFSQVAFNGHLLRALDVYAALPLFLIEVPESAAARRKRYGMLGDYRLKNYGGFEYRTLASWLVSPEWTQSVLCLCKVIAESYPVLKSQIFLSVENQRAFYRGERELFREIVLEELYPELRQLKAYEVYEEPLEWFFKQIKNQKRWNEKSDIRISWGLRPANIRPRRARS